MLHIDKLPHLLHAASPWQTHVFFSSKQFPRRFLSRSWEERIIPLIFIRYYRITGIYTYYLGFSPGEGIFFFTFYFYHFLSLDLQASFNLFLKEDRHVHQCRLFLS